MTVDGGGTLQTYCIDIHNPTQDGAKYLETPWDQTSLGANQDAGKIRWILQHSYPQVNDLAALAEQGRCRPAHRADRRGRHPGRHLALLGQGRGRRPRTRRPRSSPTGWRRTRENVAEPKASLALDPAAVSGKAGERLGPVTVRTDAGQVAVTPPADAAASGVKVIDKDGKPVTEAADGSRPVLRRPRRTPPTAPPR